MIKINWVVVIWGIILISYIISPFDMHPSLIDDLLALMGLFLIWNHRRKQMASQTFRSNAHQQSQTTDKSEANEFKAIHTLSDAYTFLQVSPQDSFTDIKRAYHKCITENHPDKVAHLSPQLQQRAHELTHMIQQAYEMICKDKGEK